jgi:hypothetical protein
VAAADGAASLALLAVEHEFSKRANATITIDTRISGSGRRESFTLLMSYVIPVNELGSMLESSVGRIDWIKDAIAAPLCRP